MHLLQPLVSIIVNIFCLNDFLQVYLVILVYDTLITLPEEIELVWCRKFRLAALFYFLARYPVVLFLFCTPVLGILDIDLQVLIIQHIKLFHLTDLGLQYDFIFRFGLKWPLLMQLYRVCSLIIHLGGTLGVMGLIGIQGKTEASLQF